jgi:tetraacyldisaccharide 4'-kinase
MSILLLPLSWLYGAATWLRNWCYDYGVFPIERVGILVVSVGNLTAGGTGKTPFVEYLTRFYLSKKMKVAIVSRGYKRNTRGTVVASDGQSVTGTVDSVGDEPFQMARKFPEAVVIVDEQRARGARIAVERFGANVVLLDDGFQHRALARDVDIVLLDGSHDVRRERLLPAGRRRESVASLKRATVLAFSDAPVYTLPFNIPAITVRALATKLVFPVDGRECSLDEIAGKRCIAVAGIGNPSRFRKTLDSLGAQIDEFLAFPDHHQFTIGDCKRIHDAYENSGSETIVTTEKDVVRFLPICTRITFPMNSLCYVQIEATVSDGENILRQMLADASTRNPQ